MYRKLLLYRLPGSSTASCDSSTVFDDDYRLLKDVHRPLTPSTCANMDSACFIGEVFLSEGFRVGALEVLILEVPTLDSR